MRQHHWSWLYLYCTLALAGCAHEQPVPAPRSYTTVEKRRPPIGVPPSYIPKVKESAPEKGSLRTQPAPALPESASLFAEPNDPLVVEPLSDQQILHVARVAHEEQLATSRMVARRAIDPRVRRIARDAEREHLRAIERVDRVARNAGLTPEESETSQRVREQAQETLLAVGESVGPELDRAYLASQADAQSRLLQLIDDKLMPAAGDETVRSVVLASRPIALRELERAIALQIRMKEKE